MLFVGLAAGTCWAAVGYNGFLEVNMNPDPQAAIPYAWCPHVIEGDSRTANAFCMICMAFMCWECHECHPYEHRNAKQS